MKVSLIRANNKTSHRLAACHRCGWDQPLTRVDGSNRGRLGSGHAYGWLCNECIGDLSAGPGSGELVGASTGTDVKRSQSRKVRSVA